MKTKISIVILFLFVCSAGWISCKYYSYVFARNVTGEVMAIDRVTQPSTIIAGSNALPPSQVFSFAIAIRDLKGDIVTASSEDRQWAVVDKGQCVQARYFPYPPWELDKAGTYNGARLIKIYDCPNKF